MNSGTQLVLRQGLRCAVRPLLICGASLLAACTTYQAPVVDEGTTVERRTPEIISSRDPAGGSARSTPARSTPARTSAPATTTGAATVAVAPARTDIARTRISRQPIDSSSAPVSRETIPGTPATASNTPVEAAGGSAVRPLRTTPPEVISSSRSVADNPATHLVKRGETLYSIAFQYALDVRRLALANNLAAPFTIYPDQILTLNQGGISENAASAVPAIPASPAGETVAESGERPQVAAESRRRETVPSRTVDGVSWQWPIQGRVTRGFGSTGGTGRGIDIEGQRGDPVYAAADGDVVYAGSGIQGAGDLIIIRHGSRLLSAYMHNNSLLVSEGARVTAGDKIAEVGNDAAGQQLLHFEIRLDGKPVDPIVFLPQR